MARVFISYDRDDHVVAQKIYDTLLNRPDVEPWLDVKRLRLVPYGPEIEGLIESSSYVMALISSASLSGSGYVVEEWAYAVARNKRALPVLLDRSLEQGAETPAILKGVREINWVRLYSSFEVGMRQVLREIYGDLASATFRETYSSLGPDNEGWRFDGWTLDDADAENENSQSIVAEVDPNFSSQRQVRIAAIPVTIGDWSRISYARKLMLRRANIMATAQFEATLSDGSRVVPIEKIVLKGMQLDHADEDWHRVEKSIDVATFRRRSMTLNFTLSASDMIAMPLTIGRAQVDNIWID